MEFTNINDDEQLRMVLSDDFEIVDGDPKFRTKWTDRFNAKQFAKELVKHNYRDGWNLLPDLPA
jgi:hypothetical protein